MLIAYSQILLLQVIAGILNFIILSLVSKYVRPEIYGHLNLYLSIVTSFSSILVSWPNPAFLRYGREEWTRFNRITETFFVRACLYFIFCCLSFIIVFLLYDTIKEFTGISIDIYQWLCLGISLMALTDMLIYATQAVGVFIPYGFVPILNRLPLLIALLLVPILNFEITADRLIQLWIIGFGISGLSCTIAFPKEVRRSFVKAKFGRSIFKNELLRKIIKYSWPIPLAAFASMILQWGSVWIIKVFEGEAKVGIYVWAYQIFTFSSFLFLPLNALLTPKMIDAYVLKQFDTIKVYMQLGLRVMCLISISCCFCVPLFYLILLQWKSEYREAYTLIIILLSALPYQFGGYIVTSLCNSVEKLFYKIVLLNIALCVISFFANLKLIARYGITAAAFISLTVSILTPIFDMVILRKVISAIPFILYFPVIGLCAIITSIFMVYLDLEIAIILSALVGFMTIILCREFKIFKINDIEMIQSFVDSKLFRSFTFRLLTWLFKR